MAEQKQLRGGTTAEHATFTGAEREVTVDTTKKTVVVHDGSTAGGIPLAKESALTAAAANVTLSGYSISGTAALPVPTDTINVALGKLAKTASDHTLRLDNIAQFGSFAGKNIAWFGTSIPAGATGNNYPEKIGTILGATVYNEAIGSSCARGGNVLKSGQNFSYVTQSSSIINGSTINDSGTIQVVAGTSYSIIENIHPSYELSMRVPGVSSYCGIIEYGGVNTAGGTFLRRLLIGGAATVYTDYVYTPTADCTRFAVCSSGNISIVVKASIDSDPYGWSGENYGHIAYGFAMTLEEKQYFIDNYSTIQPTLVSAPASLSSNEIAKILSCSYENKLDKYLFEPSVSIDLFVFDHGHNDLYANEDYLTTPTKDSANERLYFVGAMNFLIRRILSANPRAKIMICGHYATGTKANISVGQKQLASSWNLPLLPAWELTGWNDNLITTKWHWESGHLVENATTADISVLNLWLADGVHPHSDLDGETNDHLARLYAKWIATNL